jgi:hypothetical protein
MWGVFTDDQDEKHVIPCTKPGKMYPAHSLGPDCPCKPELDTKEENNPIWVHNHIDIWGRPTTKPKYERS